MTKLHVALPNHGSQKEESLSAKPLGDDAYEIDRIPICAYGLNRGDVVLATPDAPDQKPEVRSVLRRSGNQTLRASFCDRLSKEEQQPVIAELASMRCEVERATEQFVCINVPATTDLQAVRGYLVAQESAGVLEYETCEERVAGSFDDKPRLKPRDAMFLGLRTVLYPAPNLAAAKAWYAQVLGRAPYFDEPFYAGFSVGGFELGLLPEATPATNGPQPLWGVAHIEAAYARLLELGALPLEAVTEVGGGIKVAAVQDPFGNRLGIIENPDFDPSAVR